VIYLTPGIDTGCGTSLFRPKKPFDIPINLEEKQDMFLNYDRTQTDFYNEKLQENNSLFEETVIFKNIYKELKSDIGCAIPTHGYLDQWAKQGVMLLNTVLTVEAGNPQSHSKLGWEEVTDQILRHIASTAEKVIFVLWGKSAQVKKKLLASYLDSHQHRIFESAHPSPLSASKGFFGSKPFSTINTWLAEMGKEPIDWQIV
jgi:uracil DNA glycosylase